MEVCVRFLKWLFERNDPNVLASHQFWTLREAKRRGWED
jgi:hypothetical protein